jgi:Transcriptional regulator
MLDPRLLRSLIAIANASSFVHAAERLNMTQSTISQQLARLEEAVGQTLIDRAARPVAPTAAGERLLGYARRILALQQEAEAVLGDPAGTTSIRIGVPEDIVSAASAKVFGDFAKRHREVKLDVTAGLSRDLTRRYRGGEFDIVIVKEAEAGADCRATFPGSDGLVRKRQHAGQVAGSDPAGRLPARRSLSRGDVRTHRARATPLVHRLFRQQPSQRAGRGGSRTRPVASAEKRRRRISRSPIRDVRHGASDGHFTLRLGERTTGDRTCRADERGACRKAEQTRAVATAEK